MPVGDRGGKAAPKKKRPPPRPSRADKIATVAVAEQLLLPWEVRRKPKGPPPSPRFTTKPTGVPLAKPPAKKQTLDSRYKSALAAPVSPAARRHLAETMSPQRRRQVARSQRPYRAAPPSRDGLLDALAATPGSIARRVAGTGRAVGRGAEAAGLGLAGYALSPITGYQRDGGGPRISGPVGAAARLGRHPIVQAGAKVGKPIYKGAEIGTRELIVGPELSRVIEGESPRSKWWLGADIAALGTMAAPFKVGRALVRSAEAARGLKGAEASAAAKAAFDAAMQGPSPVGQAVGAVARKARKTAAIPRTPERKALHEAIDSAFPDPAAARKMKAEADDHVQILNRGLRGNAKKEQVAKSYAALRSHIQGVSDEQIDEIAGGLGKHITPERTLLGDNPEEFIRGGVANIVRQLNTGLVNAPEAPFWYTHSGQRILEAAGGDLDEAEKILQLVGIYSAQQEVVPNLGSAFRVYRQHKLGEPIKYNARFDPKARALLEGGEDWSGRKTNNFYRDLLHDMWPEKYQELVEAGALDDVTVDRHMYAMFGLPENAETYYDLVQDATREVAGLFGMQPRQAQATAWVAWKAQRLIERGKDPQAAWAAAKKTYADALDRQEYSTRFPFEARPGSAEVLPDYDSWRVEVQDAHLRAKLPAVREFLRQTGLPFTERTLGRGFWVTEDGALQVNPAFAFDLHSGLEYSMKTAGEAARTKAPLDISEGQRKVNDLIATFLGYGLRQDAASWFKPLLSPNSSYDKVAYLKVGQVTKEEMRSLAESFKGTDTWFSHGNEGIYIAYGDDIPLKDFQKRVRSTTEKLWGEQNPELVWSNLASNYIGDINAATRTASDGGRFGRVADAARQLREASDEIDGAFRVNPERAARKLGGLSESPFVRVRREAKRLIEEEEGAFRPWEFLPKKKRGPPEDPEEVAGGVRYAPGAEPPPGGAGGLPPEEPPAPPRGEEPPLPPEEPPPPLEERVAAKLPEMEAVRVEQEAGYSLPRGQRSAAYIAKYQEMRERGLSATDADLIASRELEGEYPKLSYGGFDFTPEERDRMVAIVHDSDLLPFQKKRAVTAIRDAAEGKVPQLSQIKLLEGLFGKEKAEALAKAAEEEKNKLLELVRGLGGIPRSMQSTFDMSGTLRQALTVATRHPTIWKAGLKPSVRGMLTESRYKHEMDLLARDPGFELSEVAGVHYTEVGKKAARREEQYPSSLVEHGPVAVSARQYSLFLNTLRLQMWNKLLPETERLALKAAQKKPLRVAGKRATRSKGLTEEQALKKARKDLARYVNSMTGRGPFPTKLEGAADLLNMTFFSPRLMASRFDLLLSPLTYATASPYVRRQAMRSMAQTIGIGLAVVYTASQAIPGATVEWDPRHTDFARIKIGDTRLDIWGGFQPQVRLISRLATGKFVGSSGKEWDLGTGGFGQSSRADIIIDYLRSKSSPNLSFFWDMADNQNIVGEKFEWSQQFWRLLPLLTHDVWDTWRDYSPARALGSGALGFFGIGAQTYETGRTEKRPRRRIPAGIYSGGGGGGADYSGGGGGGANYAG